VSVVKHAPHTPDTSFLRYVNIAFVPVDCTSMLHHLDVSIIHCVKTMNRKALV
jgi:hypothetical protein